MSINRQNRIHFHIAGLLACAAMLLTMTNAGLGDEMAPRFTL